MSVHRNPNEPFVTIDRGKHSKQCCAYRCKNNRAKGRKYCHKHKMRAWKFYYPEKYAYWYLKNNALRRGKDFQLTFEEFVEFCKETNYMEEKGKFGKAASIDRIDPAKGYTKDNIQVLSLSENTRKGNMERVKKDCPF